MREKLKVKKIIELAKTINQRFNNENKLFKKKFYGKIYGTLVGVISSYDFPSHLKKKKCSKLKLFFNLWKVENNFFFQHTVIQLVLLYLFTFFSCPETSIISPFVYDKENGRAEAKLYSMFKFPDSNRVHFQCDILVCKGRWYW